MSDKPHWKDHRNKENWEPEPRFERRERQDSRPNGHGPRPTQLDTILRRNFSAEQKKFDVALQRNSRGRFVKITEFRGEDNRTTVIVPESGLKALVDVLNEFAQQVAV